MSRSTDGAGPTSATSSISSTTTLARASSSWNKLPFDQQHPAHRQRRDHAQQRAPAQRLFTEQEAGAPVVFEGDSEHEEAEFVAATIGADLAKDAAPRDFAVFYRTNARSRVIEEALRVRNIPYVIVGGTRFYDRAEVKDLLSYLRVLQNPEDSIGLQRIINVPARGTGNTPLDHLLTVADEHHAGLFAALRIATQNTAILGQAAHKVAEFFALIDQAARLARLTAGRTRGEIWRNPAPRSLPRRGPGIRRPPGKPAGAHRSNAPIRAPTARSQPCRAFSNASPWRPTSTATIQTRRGRAHDGPHRERFEFRRDVRRRAGRRHLPAPAQHRRRRRDRRERRLC